MSQTHDAAIAAAARISEEFHGRDVKWVRNVQDQYVFRPVHARLGELRCLWLAPEGTPAGKGRPIRFTKDRPSLAVTTDRRTLYILGGDQSLIVPGDGPAVKDRVPVGPLIAVEYFTSKDFHDFEPTIYYHEFGSTEDGSEDLLEEWQEALVDDEGRGPVPMLSYDTLNQHFSIDGGAYSVRREGIVF